MRKISRDEKEDLHNIKCSKSKVSRVLINHDEIHERWKSYFKKSFNYNKVRKVE